MNVNIVVMLVGSGLSRNTTFGTVPYTAEWIPSTT